MNVNKTVERQKAAIKELLDGGAPLTIRITDAVCALQFRKYAIGEDATWHENQFEVKFKDASAVLVSTEDFIEYQMHYSDEALEIEQQFAENIDALRDAQNDAIAKLIDEYESRG